MRGYTVLTESLRNHRSDLGHVESYSIEHVHRWSKWTWARESFVVKSALPHHSCMCTLEITSPDHCSIDPERRRHWNGNDSKDTEKRMDPSWSYLSGWPRYHSSICWSVRMGSNEPLSRVLSGNCNCTLTLLIARRSSNLYISSRAFVGTLKRRHGIVKSHFLRWWLRKEPFIYGVDTNDELTSDPIPTNLNFLDCTYPPGPRNIIRSIERASRSMDTRKQFGQSLLTCNRLLFGVICTFRRCPLGHRIRIAAFDICCSLQIWNRDVHLLQRKHDFAQCAFRYNQIQRGSRERKMNCRR